MALSDIDKSPLYIDSTNSRVGIGTTSANKSSSSTALTVNTSSAGNYSALELSSGDTLNWYINSNNTAVYDVTAGTRPRIFYTNGAERMRIDSSGNVGIGTSSPFSFAKLTLLGTAGDQTSANQQLVISAPTTTAGQGAGIRLSAISGSKEAVGIIGVVNEASGNSGAMTFHVYNAGATIPEYMRIDSSGNLLIGTTSSTIYGGTSTGINLNPDGATSFNRTSGQAAMFNRISTDGDIVQFRKDGTTVGSIGVYSGVPYIGYQGGAGGGIMFNGATIEPTALAGTRADGANNIGSASYRWNNLYLSGGVYLGGTGSANHLDDYEEGTWTPASGGGTPAAGSAAAYIKIGRSVTVMADVTFTGVTSPTYIITGLPFQVDIVQTGACIAWNNSSRYLSLLASLNTSRLDVYDQQSSLQNINNNNRLIFAVTYQTYS